MPSLPVMSLITHCNFALIWVSALCILLDVVGGVSRQRDPLPQVAAQTPNVSVQTERFGEQAVSVQLLQPLAFQKVGLAPRHVLDAPWDHSVT